MLNKNTIQKENLVVLIFFILSTLLYLNSFNVPFYFDDHHMIENNLFIKNIKYVPWFFKGYVTSHTIAKGMCRPLLMLTFMFNYLNGKLDPIGYHILNLLVHFLNVTFLFVFLRFLKKEISLIFTTSICLLFLAHPLNTEAITYISSRSDLLATLAIGCGLLAYLRGKRWLLYICYVLSLLIKETGLCLPLLVFAYDYIFNIKGNGIKSICKGVLKDKKIVCYLVLTAITIAYLIYRKTFFLVGPASAPVRLLYPNILIQSVVSWFYLYLFIWPKSLTLAHSFPELMTMKDPLVALAVLGIAVLIILVFYFKKRKPLLSFGIAWCLVGLAPKFHARLNFVAAEHHFYFPSIGIYIILFFLLEKIYLNHKKYFNYCMAGMLCVFSLLVWIRNYEYNDRLRLWTTAVQREPSSSMAHNQLGLEYMKRGHLVEAEGEFQTALKGAHRLATKINAKNNLAVTYAVRKDYEKAIELFEDLAQIDPPHPKVNENLGSIYMKLGREDEGISAWKREMEIYSQSPGIYVVVGMYYLGKDDFNRAYALFRKAGELNPDFYLPYYGLAEVAQKKEKLKVAIQYYKKSIVLQPSFIDAHYGLGSVYTKIGDPRAIDEFKEVLRLNPNFGQAYNDLAVAYISLDKPDWSLAKIYVDKAITLGYSVDERLLETINSNF